MDSQTVKQSLYQAIREFTKLEPTADHETITSIFTTIRVFTDDRFLCLLKNELTF